MDEYLDRGYKSLRELSTKLDFPFMLKKFSENYKKIYVENICENFLKNVQGEQCKLTIFEKGLETASVFVMESARKEINQFLDISNNKKEEESQKILSSKNFENLGKKSILKFFFRICFV